jgi:hypothetical protein
MSPHLGFHVMRVERYPATESIAAVPAKPGHSVGTTREPRTEDQPQCTTRPHGPVADLATPVRTAMME